MSTMKSTSGFRKKDGFLIKKLPAVFLLFSVLLLPAYAQTEKEDSFVIKGKDGLYFKVPSDMPIIERGGTILPQPTDEYLIEKIKDLTGRVDGLGTKLDELIRKMDLLAEELERFEEQLPPEPAEKGKKESP